MIEVKNLKKVFGPIEAVKGISFKVNQGEVLGFLGPNGAGKSTVMRMLTCFLPPTAGTASVGGHDIIAAPLQVRRLIGYLPETNPVYSDMTAQSFLDFIGRMRDYRGAELQRRVEAVMQTCHLEGVREQSLDTLSKGFRRRVGLAQALLHDPPVLILDEPTDGLDPNQKYEVRALIERMARDKVIVISTHILEEVDEICTRAIIIAEGKLVADGTPAELRRRSRAHGALVITLRSRNGAISQDALKQIAGVDHVEELERGEGFARFTLYPRDGANITNPVIAATQQQGWIVEDIRHERGNLNEVFRKITQQGGRPS